MSYRLTPQTTTGMTPAEMLLGRQPRSKLDLLKTNTASRVEAKQQRQKAEHDGSSRNRSFSVGSKVYAKNFGQGQRWLSGEVKEVTGPVSFLIQLEDGRLIRRHQDHIRVRRNEGTSVARPVQTQPPLSEELPPCPDLVPVEAETATPVAAKPVKVTASQPEPEKIPEEQETRQSEIHPSPDVPLPSPATPRVKQYPSRVRKPPDWFDGPRKTPEH